LLPKAIKARCTSGVRYLKFILESERVAGPLEKFLAGGVKCGELIKSCERPFLAKKPGAAVDVEQCCPTKTFSLADQM
jgi:hypothetical protein